MFIMPCTFSAFILTIFLLSLHSSHHQAEKAKTKDDSDNDDDIKPVTEEGGNNNNTTSPTPAPTINEPDPDDEGIEFEHFTAYSSSQESPH